MKYLKIFTLTLLGILATSCSSDYLEPELTSAINGGNFYNDAGELETAVINMYDGLQGEFHQRQRQPFYSG